MEQHYIVVDKNNNSQYSRGYLTFDNRKTWYCPEDKAVYWTRCKHCRGYEDEHVDQKCLFDSTTFVLGKDNVTTEGVMVIPVEPLRNETMYEGTLRVRAQAY